MRIPLLCLVLCLAWANSWSAEAPKDNSKANQQATKADQRGTKNTPFVIEALPSKHTHTKTDDEKKQEQVKAREDSLIAESTFALAVITGFLALFTLGLMIFTYRLWTATVGLVKGTEITARQQALDMRESLGIAKQSADAAQSAAAITNFAFHLTNRPKLIVRWIYLINEREVELEVTNIGEVGAEILGMHAEMCMDKLSAKSPYTDQAGATGLPPKFIHAGQAHAIPWGVIGDEMVAEFQMELGWNEAIADGSNANDARKIYFLGYITYQDEKIHIRHRTAFCRLYDYRKRRFMPMADPDPDYEHAD